MKILAHTEVDGVVTLTVRRWRWLWPVTETWLAHASCDYASVSCHKYFNFFHSLNHHRRWYSENGEVASCRLAVQLDAAYQQAIEFPRLRAIAGRRPSRRRQSGVIRLDDRRKSRKL